MIKECYPITPFRYVVWTWDNMDEVSDFLSDCKDVMFVSRSVIKGDDGVGSVVNYRYGVLFDLFIGVHIVLDNNNEIRHFDNEEQFLASYSKERISDD